MKNRYFTRIIACIALSAVLSSFLAFPAKDSAKNVTSTVVMEQSVINTSDSSKEDSKDALKSVVSSKITKLATASATTAAAVESPLVNAPATFTYSLNNTKSLYLNLSKVDGVTGYIIYTTNANGNNRVEIKRTKKNTKTSIKINKLTYGKTYYFQITSYVLGADGVSCMESAPDLLTVSFKVRLRKSGKYRFFYDEEGRVVEEPMNFLSTVTETPKYKIVVNNQKCFITFYAANKNGNYCIPLRTYLCSPGTYTPTGNYTMGGKYRYKVLFYNSYAQWTADITGNILFHTSPYKKYHTNNTLDVKEYNKLGTRASHGCIRLQCEAAKWIYDNCSSYSTPIQIYNGKDEGPFGLPVLEKLPKWHKWDPTDPNMKSKCEDKGCTHTAKVYTSTPVD